LSKVSTIIQYIGDELGQGITITSTSRPSTAEIIRRINRTTKTFAKILAQYQSDLSREEGTITTVSGTAEYSDLASDMLTPDDTAYYIDGDSKVPIYKKNYQEILYLPTDSAAPYYFYVTKDNYIGFYPIPDDTYTIKVPYWHIGEEVSSENDDMPFKGMLDDIYVEVIVRRLLNRDEFNVDFESRWLQFVTMNILSTLNLRRENLTQLGKNDYL